MGAVHRVPHGTLTKDFAVSSDADFDDGTTIAESYAYAARCRSNAARAAVIARTFGVRSRISGPPLRDVAIRPRVYMAKIKDSPNRERRVKL
jgi:hypothetical protein